ncbi:lytic polysaccharide monooxygenase [Aulographum hederae CBS 113979]|uniref:Lytic polysaccharide monooxygenase n=1 Tax=Aulographum hederae CBS 113979 TaxID=1176131 RepID=A0A6G1H0I2_9PEZI|nr:lytic polysaccharide monooxygenase [Aulographum hederae CBS 113979]
MVSFRSSAILATLAASLIHIIASECHMQMSNPFPIRSVLDPETQESDKDYSMTSPLNADGSNYPCKGYQNDRPIRTTATYVAGKTYSMSLAGTVTHGGGSCQLSLSYDNGATFKVIKSMIGGCPDPADTDLSYDFTIPSFAPSGQALFAWSWNNHMGRREFYMNCAQVNIVGSSAARRSNSRRTGEFTSMDSLPNIWKANLQGLNDCVMPEGFDAVYPNPGPDVEYGKGFDVALNQNATESAGQNCDAAEPYGQTYKEMGDTGAGKSAGGATADTPVATASPDSAPASSPAPGVFAPGASSQAPESTEPAPTPAPAPASSPAPGVFAPGASSQAPEPTEPAPIPAPAPVTSSTPLAPSYTATSMLTVVLTTSVSPPMFSPTIPAVSIPAPPSMPSAAPPVPLSTGAPSFPEPQPGSPALSFASAANITSYLPCMGGTMLCTSPSTFVICAEAGTGNPYDPGWKYNAEQLVAGGMTCVPHVSPFAGNVIATTFQGGFRGQGVVPEGWFRSDRYI